MSEREDYRAFQRAMRDAAGVRLAAARAEHAARLALQQKGQGVDGSPVPAQQRCTPSSLGAVPVLPLEASGGTGEDDLRKGSKGGVPLRPLLSVKWSHVGTDVSAAKDSWCCRPQRFSRVDHSGNLESFVRACGSGRKSVCAYCAEIKRGDIAAIGRSGFIDRPTDGGFMLTLTAPGADVLPWDVSKCSHTCGVPCSGVIGCEVDADALAMWHNGIGLRWSHFVTDVRRVLGEGVSVEFFKTWEVQGRGALHAHAMVRTVGVSHRRLSAAVKLCARRNGFGRQYKLDAVDLSDSRSIAMTAGYIAKYVSKSADALPDLRSMTPDGEVVKGGVRSWSASRGWGDSMKSVHLRRVRWWATQRVSALAQDDVSPATVPGLTAAAGGLDLNSDFYAMSTAGGVVAM